MNRVSHFEVHAKNPAEMAKFYKEVFGWEVSKWENPGDEYWLVTTGPNDQAGGINGGITVRRGDLPIEGAAVNSYVCSIDVANLDEMIAKVKQAGGTIAHEKQAIPGMGWLAYCKDIDGNIFGMMQEDKGAK